MSITQIIKNACYQNIHCKQNDCKKSHQRMFAGICIQGFIENTKDGKCNKNQCQLLHFKPKELKDLYDAKAINGVYKFNLCPNLHKDCQQDSEKCRFIHPKWAIGYCQKYLSNECEDEEENCTMKLKHIDWGKLQEKVYKEYDISKINPENICCKEGCFCDNHLNQTDLICISYFKGECPNIKCTKSHVNWESFQQNIGKIYSTVLKPCNQVYKDKKSKANSQSIQDHQPIYLKKEQFKQIQQQISKQNIIDIIIIMDLTGSMDPWKVQIHACINEIMDKFKVYVENYSLRIAFVGYRDYIIDKNTGKISDNQHVIFHDFTENINKLKHFINSQKAEGGDDEAEDIISGLKKAMLLNISKHPESMLITFLFADAPNHGKQYYKQCNDSLRDQIPEGSLENVMKSYKRLKQKNYFSCVTINDSTKQMYQIMEKNFEGLMISSTMQPLQMEEYVKFTLKNSYQDSQSKKIEQKEIISFNVTFKKSKYLSYQCQTKEEKVKYWKEFNNTLKLTERSGNTLIKIEKQKLECVQGVQSYVFKLFDTTNNQFMLAKLPKEVVDEFVKDNKLQDSTYSKAIQYNEAKFLSQSIAKQMAQIYRDSSYKINGAPPIFYASPIIYLLQEQKFYGLNQIYAETYIDLQSNWNKFANNQAYVEKQNGHLTSFSHFTYQESNGQFVIMDLQGKENILSDPSIQSFLGFSQILNNDDTNQNDQGLGQFLFGQHKQCNIICQELKLQREMYQENKLINQDKWQLHESQNVNIICETCDQFLDITQQEYRQQLYKKCQYCQEMEKETQQFYCTCCLNLCEEAKNLNLKKLTKYDICQNCRIQCLGILDKCNYCQLSCKLYLTKNKISDKEIQICRDGRKYLNALSCKNCKQPYNNDILLDKQQYELGNYTCKKCQK